MSAADEPVRHLLVLARLVTFADIVEHLDPDGLRLVQQWLFEPDVRRTMAAPARHELHRLLAELLADLLLEHEKGKRP